MPTYKAPIKDYQFILTDVLNTQNLLNLEGYEEFSTDLLDQILEEAGKFCENELLPINLSGDEEGCKFENGVVRTPKGFKELYDLFCQSGWSALACDPKYGGQGLPQFVNFPFLEMVCSTNLSFGMYPGLSHGAYDALLHHGSDALKDKYLPKLVSGEWSGTMCLTEPHCGTDLGLIKTKATPQDDGSYNVTGTKIFISAGEHDLTQNILHLVLAKLPNAPDGIKGISLFLVPKYVPNDAGGLGPNNNVKCGSIEHKMGIRASSTCVMNFDDAKGWLVGEPHKGMRAMFTMMNYARLAVGMQGLGLAEISYQNALAYAKDRLQGRALTGAQHPEKPADPIIVHADIRKNLLEMKSFIEGARALSCWLASNLDTATKNKDPQKRQEADDLVTLLTPIVKSFFTDHGFNTTNKGVQIYGGHGYIHEYGMEQFVRDARITQIYEGANGIQALDLVGRKLATGFGRLLRRFFHPVQADLEKWQETPDLLEFLMPFAKGFGKLQQATALIAQKGMSNPDEAAAASTDYLNLFGYVAIGYMWMRMAEQAQKALSGNPENKSFYTSKLKTARFFMQKIMPETSALFIKITAGANPVMDIEEGEF